VAEAGRSTRRLSPLADSPRHDSEIAAGEFWAPGLLRGRPALKPKPAGSLLPECRCCETIGPSESGGSDDSARTGTITATSIPQAALATAVPPDGAAASTRAEQAIASLAGSFRALRN